jgi:5'-deoxynucleotidase YfbR-like HD superfamily hydrolase
MELKDLINDSELSVLDSINRWNMNQVIKTETVSQHSFWVVFYSHIISEALFPGYEKVNDICLKLDVLRKATFHDLEEIFSGDVNHIVKHNKLNGIQITEQLDLFCEAEMREKFNSKCSYDDSILYSLYHKSDYADGVNSIVKLADWFSFLKYINNEISLGNKNFFEIKKYCINKTYAQIRIVKSKFNDNKFLFILDEILREQHV